MLAQRHALALAKARGEVIARAAVIDCWQRAFMVVRGRLLALPTRLASQCADRPAPQVQAAAKRLIHEALTELANFDGLPQDDAPDL